MKRRKKQRKNISKNYVGISDYLMQNNFLQNEEIRQRYAPIFLKINSYQARRECH